MPFLAPLAGPLIKGGISLGASLIGGKLLKQKPNAQEQAALDSSTNQLQRGREVSDQLLPQGYDATRTGVNAINPVINYWSGLLAGNRGGATSLMAPELNRISQGYRTTAQNVSQLLPRGGGRASLLSELPYQQQRDSQELLQRARPQAATNLLEAGRTSAGIGEGIVSNAVNALYGSTNAGRTILDYNQQRRAADRSTGGAIGNFVFDLLKNVNLKTGKGGGGGGILAKDYPDFPDIG